MELLETKKPIKYNDDIKMLLKILKFYKLPIDIKGSYILENIKFFSDYDLYTDVKNLNLTTKEIYEEFVRILRNILENNNTYFTEFKIQNTNNTKYKYFPNDEFSLSSFSNNFNKENIDYCKIDLVLFSDNKFTEVSCIYNFSSKPIQKEQIIKKLDNDIKDLKKENNYFKILKRLFSIYKIKDDKNKVDYLLRFFNSEGEIYKNKSNIDAIELVKKYYNDALTKKRIETNLNEINYNEKVFKNNEKILNNKSKEIYNQLT